MKGRGRRAEQRLRVAFGGAVGVHLDEHPFRPPRHRDAAREPVGEPAARRRVAGVERAALDARHNAPPGPTPAERERPLHKQELRRRRRPADRGAHAPIVALRNAGARVRVVDPVDDAGLRRRGRRREREVRVAARRLQDRQFPVHAAPSPARQRVVERPVPVDEAVAHRARPISRQQPVPIMERRGEAVQLFAQRSAVSLS